MHCNRGDDGSDGHRGCEVGDSGGIACNGGETEIIGGGFDCDHKQVYSLSYEKVNLVLTR